MSEEEKQMFNKMIYCNLINGEQALKFNRKYEDLQQKVEQLEKENIKQKEIIENLTTMTVCGDKKQIKNTAQYKLEQLESIRKEAIEYMKEFIFEPLLISEDRKLIMFNENLKNFENILNKGDNNGK